MGWSEGEEEMGSELKERCKGSVERKGKRKKEKKRKREGGLRIE